jgi:hypothetical protein
LKRQQQPSQEEGPKVPAYIVTFSDMTTLLLTFFVMLLSLAKMQDPELFKKGRDSFRFSLDYLGLGILMDREQKTNLGNVKINFTVTNIRFAQGDARLDESAKQFLGGFCSQLQQNYGSRPVKLYVLGLANDQRVGIGFPNTKQYNRRLV